MGSPDRRGSRPTATRKYTVHSLRPDEHSERSQSAKPAPMWNASATDSVMGSSSLAHSPTRPASNAQRI
jgi:hypothetical protein